MSVDVAAPVIIDTDPGLDDALALFLAFRSPELDVLGVVSVAGNIGIDLTTANVRRILRLLGREDVPVLRGAARPFRREPFHAPGIHGEDGVGGVDLPEAGAPEHPADAVDWMADSIAAHPAGTVRILALGPLTNIARLVVERPEEARLLRGVIAMGGAVRGRGNVTPHAEFNIAADPEAADIVLRAGLPLTLVPLDVTRQVAADEAWADELARTGGELARFTRQLVAAYLDNVERFLAPRGLPRPPAFPLHDPCVMLHALRPDLFEAERLPLRVVTDHSEEDGATRLDPHGAEVEVLMRADKQAALAFAAERLRG